MTLKVPPSR
ncbi:hypothetical protein AYI68_g2086, partial [Smittium mucronatum]